MADQTFTADQGFAAQKALRDALDMGPAEFATPDLVRMLGDEIAAHREAGRDWASIAEVVSDATGQPIDPSALERHHGEGGARG